MSDASAAPGSTVPSLDGPAPLSAGGVVFLGCGSAAVMHAGTLARIDPERPRFFASRSAEKAHAYSERHRGSGSFAGYDTALEDDRVEVAVVVTPPNSHLEWTLSALEAGKHVIVEKPAFLRATDFDRVRDAASAARRQVLVAENYAYKPLVQELRWIFEDDPLGRILFLQVNAVKQQSVRGWRTEPVHVSGGALFEGGIHWISLLAHLGPEVEAVRALEVGPRGGPEWSMQVLLRYDQGAVASLSYSWEVPSPLKGLRMSRIYGTKGSAVFESNGAFFTTLGRPLRTRVVTQDLLGYRAMFRDFLDALSSGVAPRFTLEDARRDVEIVEEAYRSAGVHREGIGSAKERNREGETG